MPAPTMAKLVDVLEAVGAGATAEVVGFVLPAMQSAMVTPAPWRYDYDDVDGTEGSLSVIANSFYAPLSPSGAKACPPGRRVASEKAGVGSFGCGILPVPAQLAKKTEPSTHTHTHALLIVTGSNASI